MIGPWVTICGLQTPQPYMQGVMKIFFGVAKPMVGHNLPPRIEIGSTYSYLSNKRVGYNKQVGQKIHPTRSTSG